MECIQGNLPIPLPGEWIEHNNAASPHVHTVRKCRDGVFIRCANKPRGVVDVVGVILPRGGHQLILWREPPGPQLVPALAVGLFDVVLVCQPPGVLAEQHAPLIGTGDHIRDPGPEYPPAPLEHRELVERPNHGADVMSLPARARHAHGSMNPRIGNVTAHHWQTSQILLQNQRRKIVHGSDPRLDSPFRVKLNVLLHGFRCGRALVVPRHADVNPALVGPVRRGQRVAPVSIIVERQQPGTIRPLPPEKRRQAQRLVHKRPAHVIELDPGMGKKSRKNPGLPRHIAHLRTDGERLAKPAVDGGGNVQPAHQILQLRRLGVRCERISVNCQVAIPDGLLNLLPPFRGLTIPDDLLHRPAGKGPDKLLVLGLPDVHLDRIQHTIRHLRPVFMHHIPRPCRIANVKVGLVNDHHRFQRRHGGHSGLSPLPHRLGLDQSP